jgi:uncharacterized protein (TIGR00297 family)
MWPTIVDNLLMSLWLHLPFALAAWGLRLVNFSGFLGGLLLGELIFLGAGWRGWLILVGFFTLAVGATKLGYTKKAERELAQEEGGRRGAKHALANSAWAVLLALALPVFAAWWPAGLLPLTLAYVGAFATAVSDTGSSELGQLYGTKPVLITTFRRVPPGTAGAVSWQGTLGGLALAALLGLLAASVGLIPWSTVWIPPLAGLLGSSFESYLGAWLPAGGLSNEVENFLNTVVGSLAAFGLSWLVV